MKKIEAYQAANTEGICLNANESSLNLSEEIRTEISEAVMNLEFNRYPDDSESQLLEAYAKVCGLNSDQLLAGNGSDQMLGMMIGCYLGKGKVLVTLKPDFSMYDYYAQSYEAIVKKFETEADGKFDVSMFIDYAQTVNADMILFSNPNNPTGHLLSKEEIKEIAEAFPHIPVLIDEAYQEFAGDSSVISLVEEYSNLFVTRTLSKAYALAGLRVGFLACNKDTMSQLKAAKVPYALSTMSMKAAGIVLNHAEEFQKAAAETVERRNWMYKQVKDMKKATFVPSSANFLFGFSEHKARLMDMLEAVGITIRTYKDDSFRITIGTEEELQAVLKVLNAFETEA